MASDELENSLKDITLELQQYEAPTITGQQLGEYLIPRAAPSLNVRKVVDKPFGSGALRAFISLYLSEYLAPVDRSGADIVYRILRAPSAPPSGTIASTPQIWTTFASPTGPFQLFLNKTTRQLIVLSNDTASIPDDLAAIHSATIAELNCIRNDFVTSIADSPENDALKNQLKRIDDYSSWISLLRRENSLEYKRWNSFRRNAIDALFKTRLDEIGVDEENTTLLLHQLRDSQFRANRSDLRKSYAITKKRDTPSPQAKPRDDRSPSQQDDDFLRLLIDVISRMPPSEIRKIRVPYGVVYDVLTKDKKR